MARMMADRWPNADVVGSDLSIEMLEAARQPPSRVKWQQIDIAEWEPTSPLDLVFANAVLHWLGDHAALLRRLHGYLAPGGVLAVQMPLTSYEPAFRLVGATLAELGSGSADLRRRFGSPWVQPPDFYFEVLAPLAAHLDMWTTTYYHVLTGPNPVLEWVRGALLRPVLDELTKEGVDQFLSAYGAALTAAYPRRAAGEILFPFPRLFFVSTAPG